ncbi:MAG: Na/Pi symporter [Cyclobacteriaceae bacterium]|nr:Na/Pi symporter [Cyclobacteriaceae bacterium]
MISSLQHLNKSVAETILQATSNPFTGLFIGLLITAMLQSSSTTTSIVVALVASGSITIENAIPIIMGANVGTTITSTIVSLGFINKKKEFRRAVAAGTYHDFFNILTVIILFPLEYYYGFLSRTSQWIGNYFFTPSTVVTSTKITHFWPDFGPLIEELLEFVPSGWLTLISFVLLFSSILLFRKMISNWMLVRSPDHFSRFFFKNYFKSFLLGTLITSAIRSSTITTSLVVPLVAKKVTTLRKAAPFILGANMGTTITAFIAVALNSNTSGGISIAIAHFLFNFIGVLIFFPIPALRRFPIELAEGLGRLTLRYRLVGLVYLLLNFFFIPFSLIYFNQDTIQTLEIVYVQRDSVETRYHRIISHINQRTQSGEWSTYDGREDSGEQPPLKIYPVSVRNTSLFIGNEMFLFNKPGYCWDGEGVEGKYNACIEKIESQVKLQNGLSFDSVYVCRLHYSDQFSRDSTTQLFYLSAPLKIIVKREVLNSHGQKLFAEEVVSLQSK